MTGAAGLLLCLAALQVSAPASPALPIRVIGIIISSTDAACVIRCTDTPGSWGLFRTGQRACDVADVQKIDRDRVVVKDVATNRSEVLVVPTARQGIAAVDPLPAPPPQPLTRDIPKTQIEHYLTNLPEVLGSALATPRTREMRRGQQAIDGFEITEITPGGAADQLGLKDGDVILEVNGQPLNGMPTIMRLLAELRTATQTTLTVLRDGQRMTLVFNSR